MENLNLDKTYIINPKYLLKHDIKRTLIVIRNPYEKSSDVNVDIHSFIHPVQAMILSFFDGEKDLSRVVEDIATFTDLSYDDCLNDIKLYINNDDFTISFEKHRIHFPKNFIIEKTNNTFFTYNVDDFLFEELDFDSFRLFQGPLDITLMLNNNCYTDCIYCYADCNYDVKHYIPYTRIKDLIDESISLGVRNIDLMGGEVLNHPNWENIIEHLIANNYHPYISTKQPLPFEKIKKIKATGLREIQLSIDTLNPSVAEIMLNANHSYVDKIKETIFNFSKIGFQIIINSVVSKYNCTIDNYKQIFDYLNEFDNIKEFKVTPMGFSLYKTEDHFKDIKPSIANLEVLSQYIENESKVLKFELIMSNFSTNKEYSNSSKITNFNNRNRCTSNQDQIYILPNGSVTVCEELMFNETFIIGNINIERVKEIWDNNMYSLILQKKMEQNTICSSCEEFDSCHLNKGVCWKEIMYAYGKDNWHYPDPRCPKSPEPTVEFYLK